MPKEWFNFNAYLKIGDNGVVTIFTPNPEFGQNVMTSMPMIVAEELDVDWKNVLVEMAPHDPVSFPPAAFGQFTGGSRGIMSKWEPLRNAGAAARHMLKEAAAQAWQVPADEITTAAPEKMLVDIVAEPDIFVAQQGELQHIFENMFSQILIHQNRLLRYARRRKREEQVLGKIPEQHRLKT